MVERVPGERADDVGPPSAQLGRAARVECCDLLLGDPVVEVAATGKRRPLLVTNEPGLDRVVRSRSRSATYS